MTNSIQIIKKIPDTPLQQLKLDMAPSIEAESGAIYTLIDEQTGQYPEGVELQQLGDDLHVMRDGEVLLVIEDFYDEIGQGTHQVSFDEFASIVTPDNMLSVESPMWHEEMDVVVSLDDSTTAEPSSVEQGEMLSSKPMVDNNPSEGTTGAEEVEAGSGIGWGWYAAAGLGALALGASGSGSSSDSGSSSSSSSVTISAAAGVFFSEVQVDLYSEDGSLLSSANHDYSTGDYVYTGSYSGAILVEITDINGDAGDYTDETTGESKSLGTTLRAMATMDGDGEEAISVTPLTELATQLAGVTTGEAFTTEDVEVNDKVADLFGLDDLLAKPTVLTEDTDGADEASLKYGEALAILSGADSANGTTATETITAIAESLTNDDGSLIESEDGELQLTSEVTNILAEGLETFNESDLGGDYTISEGFDFISAPTLVDADGEGLGWINSFLVETEKDNSINVKIKGVSVDDEVTVSVGEESTSLTVTADDIVDDAYVLISIQGSWFDGEDGTYTVTVSVNGEEQDVLVKLDTQAPGDAVIALANDAGSEADDYLTSDATVNVTLADDTVTWEYSLEGGVNWVEGEGTSFELSEGSYAEGVIQVRQFDAAGNITITEFLEVVTVDLTGPSEAPTIALVEDTGSSDSDQVTSNGLVNVTLTGDAVAWEYSVDAGVTWQTGTDSSFTIEEGVYGEGDVQVRQSDEAGNVSEVAELGEITVDVTAPDSTAFSIDGTTVAVTLSDDENSWEYSLDGGDSWTTGSDASFEILEDTTYAAGDIQVRETDVAGNESAVVSNETEVLVDTSAPTAPTITLAEDTGSSDGDQVTSNGLVNVTLTGDAVAWEYSVDAGVTWQTGTDSSFTVEEGVYAEGDVQVRQSDEAGNVGEVAGLGDITVDMTAPDSTAFSIDGTTVTVTLSDDENSWEYSLDGGDSWTTGSDASFDILEDTTYAAGDIQVRETDVAGNIGEAISNGSEIFVEQEIPALPAFDGLISTDSSAISHELVGDYSDILTLSYSDGSFVQAWVEHNEDEDVQYLIVQKYTSSGVEDGLYYGIELGATDESYVLEGISQVSSSGDFAISWFDGDVNDGSDFFVQVFGSTGKVIGETIEVPGSEVWGDSVVLQDFSSDNMFSISWTEGDFESYSAFVQFYNGETGEAIGDLIEYEDSVVPDVVQTPDGSFYVVSHSVDNFEDFNVNVVVRTYDDTGSAVGESLILNSDESSYLVEATSLNSDSAVFVLLNEDDASATLNIVESGEQIASIELTDLRSEVELEYIGGDTENGTGSYEVVVDENGDEVLSFELRLIKLNDDGDFAVAWFSLNENDEPTVYTQSFSSDGAALNEAVAIPYWNDNLEDYEGYNTTIYMENSGNSSGYYVNAEYYSDSVGQYHIGVYFVSNDEDNAVVTEIVSYEGGSNDFGYYSVESIGDSGNVAVIFTLNSTSTIQLFDTDGDSYSDAITFTDALYSDFNIEVIGEGEDGFILSWNESGDNSSVIYYSQIYDVEGNAVSILQTDVEGGEVYVQTDEGSTVFLISVDEDISSVSDIEDLDLDDYLEVSAEADGVTTLSTDDLYAGEYYVYQLYADGSLSRDSSVITLSGEDYSVDEPEIDFEDTGYDDSDFITKAEQMTVTLTGDAVGWEYSLDHGETWIEGSGESLDFELNRTYNLNEIQIRQFDADGIRGEISSNDIIVVQDSEVSEVVFTSIEDGLVTLELDDDLYQWEYSLDGGTTFTVGSGNTFYLESNTTYDTSEIHVKQTDEAGNVSQVTNTEEVVVGDFFAPPSFSLYEDTGVSDSDGITDDGGVLVTLSNDAVSWEFSLDGGGTWEEGLGAYVELGEIITVDDDFVVYEIDSEGNQIQELDDYYEGEVIEGELGFELSESGNGWEYSLDGGETFTSYAWEDMEGYFFVLDDDTEYPAGDIQVRQYNEEGDVSDAAVSTQDIVITDAEEETDDSEGDDGDNEDSFFVAVDLSDSTTSWSYSLDGGTTTEYGVAYIALSSDDANVFEDDGELRLSLDDFEAYLIDSDGNQTKIDIINEEDGYIENVFAFVIDADTSGWTYSTDGGDTFITESWGDQDGNGMLVGVDADYDRYEIQITQNYDDGTTRTALVTEDVYFEGDDISYVIDAESAVIIDDDNGEYLTGTAVGDGGSFAIFTSGTLDGEEYESALLIDEDGNVEATLEGSDAFEDGQIVSLNDGKFIIFNENVINLYSSTGELLNTATTEFSDYDEIYVVEAIDDGYVAFIKDFATIEGVKYDYLYANTYDSDGVLQSTTEDLMVTSTDVGITDLFVEAFSDGSFVATWAERNDASTESQTYLQAFNADGTTDGSQITIFETNDQGWTNLNSSDFQIIASGDGGYIVLGKYDIENEETGLDEGRYYFEIYVDSDGNVTSLYDSDEGNISASALFVGDEGDFVIAHNLVEVNGYGINVQRYNADGSTDGDAILLEASEHSFDRDPTVSALDDGGYQVEWLSDVYVDGETITIVSVQEFSSAGELLDDTTEVVIDLVGDDSTEVGTFSADETYEIYINIDVTVTEDLNAVEAIWSGAENLGDDDIIILINDSVDAFSNADDELTWSFEDDSVFLTGSAVLDGEGEFSVSDTFTTDLWDGEWSATPNNGLSLADVAIDDYPSDV
ncbi:MAG: hypothetical protein ABJN96_04395 [Marinomonas sp.]